MARLENANYSIGTLGDGLLGETSGNNVVIDATAQGNGWSESATPQPGQMDLFTTLGTRNGPRSRLARSDDATQRSDVRVAAARRAQDASTTQDVDAVFIASQ